MKDAAPFDGRELRAQRVRHGLLQRDLARELGVPRQRIGDWELELRPPTHAQLAALMYFFEALDQSAAGGRR
jgi:transcriptional regulator with XRE-family HTH domain